MSGESLGRVGHAIKLSRAKEPKLPRPPVGVYIQTSRRRVRKRARRRDVVDAPVATRQAVLTVSQKSSSRARRSVPYSRPAVRFLKRAVDAVKATTLRQQGPRPSGQSVADWARRSFTSSVALSPPQPSQTPTTAQHSPPPRQLSAGEGSSRPPATIYRISLTNGAGRVLLRRDVARGPRVEGVCYGSAERPLWLLACAVAIRCCLK